MTVLALREALDVAMRVAERDEIVQTAAQLSWCWHGWRRPPRRRGWPTSRSVGSGGECHHPGAGPHGRCPGVAGRRHIGRADGTMRGTLDLVPADMLDLRAQLHLGLGESLAAAGRTAEARAATDHAVELHTAKGNTIEAERAARGPWRTRDGEE